MKRFLLWSFACLLGTVGFSQPANKENTLLWRITGKGLSAPSYLFGTIHMICGDDIQLSDSLRTAIRRSDRVYLELDMDNLFELMGAVSKMKMNGDTTLADLLKPDEYQKVKKFFTEKSTLLPFHLLETYKPMLAASTLMQTAMECEDAVAMEQLVMKEAKKQDKQIKGLETMTFQMSIFDSIPYKLQAQHLLQYVENYGNEQENKEYQELVNAYRNQELVKLEEMTRKDDAGMERFTEILLYNRNADWVNKLEGLLTAQSLVVAVGAGHLPGDRGVINLLRKKGYRVEPVRNDMFKKYEKQL